MTRKHFIALANAINESHGHFDELVDRVAAVCANSTPNFDRHRFVDACNA